VQRSAFVTAKIISFSEKRLALWNIALAVRIQYHLFSPRSGEVWIAHRAFARNQIGSQGGNYNPCDDDK
jgi:hypothetical protein